MREDRCVGQRPTLPGEKLTAEIIAVLAREVMTLDEQIKHTDTLIEGRFRQHRLAPVIESMPGIGVVLGAELLAATGGDMTIFATPDRLAAFAGLAPRDPGASAATCTGPGTTTAA